MRERIRRDYYNRYRENGGVMDVGGKNLEAVFERFSESSYPGSNNCTHIKYGAFPFYTWTRLDGRYRWFFENCPAVPDLYIIYQQLNPYLVSLNWDKLPSSSQFGILQILAEIDDTLLMFTRKFWQSISYGSITWGVIPFVSDLVAVANAVANLALDLSQFSYEDELVVPIGYDYVPTVTDYNRLIVDGKAVLRHTGFGDLSFQNPASLALDWLALHPDLATAWDLIPFSFVVDYLFPVGDFLESFRGGGWVKALRFNGWRTCLITGTVTEEHASTGWPTVRSPSGSFSAFTRVFHNDILTVYADHDSPSFETPSIREMFNILYLLMGRK